MGGSGRITKGELPVGNSPFNLLPPITAHYRLLPPLDARPLCVLMY
jgi:hypothetical protein